MIIPSMRRPFSGFVLLIYLAVGGAIFGHSLDFPFLLDDEDQIVQNPFIHSFGHIFDLFLGSTLNSGGANQMVGIYYKPIMMLSYMVLWFFSPNDPFLFHSFQLLIHVVNAFLVFLIFNQLFSQEVGTFKSQAAQIAAFCCGLIFVIHPLNVSSVVYLANLQENLFTFFGLISLNLLMSFKKLSFKKWVGLGSLLLLSLLSKESGVLYLLTTLTYCLIYKRDRLKAVSWVTGITTLTYLCLRIGLAHLNSVRFNSSKMHRASLETRLLTVPKVIWHYIQTFFYPKYLTVTQDWEVSRTNIEDFWLPLIFVLLLAAGVLIFNRLKPSRILQFLTLWVILGLGMHSQLVPLDGTVSDRWFYFPMVGFLGILALLLVQLFAVTPKETLPNLPKLQASWIAVLLTALFLTLGTRSYLRTLNWKDAFTLYLHDLTIQPDSYYLNNNVGVELFRRGQITESKGYFEKSTQLFPEWTINWSNLGAAYEALGLLKEAEASYKNSMKNGVYHHALENYAQLLFRQNRIQELRTFLEGEGLRLLPNNPVLQNIYRALPPS